MFLVSDLRRKKCIISITTKTITYLTTREPVIASKTELIVYVYSKHCVILPLRHAIFRQWCGDMLSCHLMERYHLLLSQFNFENNNETQWNEKKQAIVVVFHYKSVILKNSFPNLLNRIKANKKSSRFQRSWADAKCLLNMLDTQWSTICDTFYFIFEDGLFHDPIIFEGRYVTCRS